MSDITRRKCGAWFSEFSVANRLLFRDVYRFQASAAGDRWLEGTRRSGGRFATPKAALSRDDLTAAVEAEIAAFLASGFEVGPFDQAAASCLCDRLAAVANCHRNDADYLYRTDAMRSPDWPPHQRARRYLRATAAATEPAMLAGDDFAAARELAQRWHARRRPEVGPTDITETLIALDLAEAGLLTSVGLRVAGNLVAFVVADISLADQIVALILKTELQPQALTELCFQSLCRAYPDKTYLNTCQDLGLVGLRKKKLGMAPDRLLDKYYLRSRGPEPQRSA